MCLEERDGRLQLVHRRHEWGSERIIEKKAYDLGLSTASCRVVACGGDGPDFWAYIAERGHLHYVSYWLPNKIRAMRVPRASFDGLQVLSPHYARIEARVYCRGAWVEDADAERFRLVADTRFAHDDARIYAFTITEGMDVLGHAQRPLYFLPCCEYFADRRHFYWQSSGTRRIERASGYARVDAYEKRRILAQRWRDDGLQGEPDEATQATVFDRMRTVADLFRLALPDADADWAHAAPARP